jgi:predicted RNA-binding Zn-ribbon protein involved in translation (DUF1610 family)
MGLKFSGNKKIQPIEPVCKKTMYSSPEEAQEMIRYIKEHRSTRNLYAYKCPVCGLWHLTSKTEK